MVDNFLCAVEVLKQNAKVVDYLKRTREEALKMYAGTLSFVTTHCVLVIWLYAHPTTIRINVD
jgi:hypothetical protein